MTQHCKRADTWAFNTYMLCVTMLFWMLGTCDDYAQTGKFNLGYAAWRDARP